MHSAGRQGKGPDESGNGGLTPPKMKEWEHRRLELDDLFLFGADAEETLGGVGRKDPRGRGGPIDQVGALLENDPNAGGCIFGITVANFLEGACSEPTMRKVTKASEAPKSQLPLLELFQRSWL